MNIEQYKELTTDKPLTVNLSPDQQVVILKAYDYGLSALNDSDEALLDAVISHLKDAIHP